MCVWWKLSQSIPDGMVRALCPMQCFLDWEDVARPKEGVLNLTLSDRFRWGWLSAKEAMWIRAQGLSKFIRLQGK